MTDTDVKPQTKRFRRAFVGTRPDPALVGRQMEATTRAFAVLGSADAARLFLNTPNDALDGRPIDIAGGSADGLARVIDAMKMPHPVGG